MRVLLPFLLIAIFAGSAIYLLFDSGASPPVAPMEAVSPPASPPSAAFSTQSAHPPDVGPSLSHEVDPASAPRAVATRVAVDPPPPSDLADAPTTWVRILDHATTQPIAGASLRRMKDGSVLGFTDERGLCGLPLREREQLMTIADGYLLRMTPASVGRPESTPQRVELVRDRWSAVRRFEFRAAGDAKVEEAFVQVVDYSPCENGVDARAPSAGDIVASRAWREHLVLAKAAIVADVPVHGGAAGEPMLIHDGEKVRFTAAGRYHYEAATKEGLVQRSYFEITPGERGRVRDIRVHLSPGQYVYGTVLGGGVPLTGATLERQGGDPLGLVGTTGTDGTFAFGPLAPGEVTLLVRHPDHEPCAHGPIAVGSKNVLIDLRPLPSSVLKGRVRRRPDLKPVAGAAVSWITGQDRPKVARTEADGTFRLVATGEIAGRISISAPGYLGYEELVEPGAPFADYDLLPGSTSDRVAKGLTAVLAGIVVDAEGKPVAAAHVRWYPASKVLPSGFPTRRVLRGATLDLGLETVTRSDGSFVLETDRFGAGFLGLADRDPDQGLRTEAIAGRRRDGYRLRR